ncbi:MAG: S8 family serine peptidase [Flavobacteriales bacterium]
MRKIYCWTLLISLTLANGQEVSVSKLKSQLQTKKEERLKHLKKLQKEKVLTKTDKKTRSVKYGLIEKDSLEDGRMIYFRGIGINNQPQFYQTNNYGGSVTSGVEYLRKGNKKNTYFGEGIEIGEWDGGVVYRKHMDFGNRVINKEGFYQATFHATHVGGTIAGDGTGSKELGIESTEGMAPKAILKTYDWEDDGIEMIEEAENGLILSNHSYGNVGGVADLGYDLPIFFGYINDKEDYHYGLYGASEAEIDAITYNFPHYLSVWASGNEADKKGIEEGTEHYAWDGTQFVISTKERDASCATGFDCITTYGAIGKNVLTVGAIFKENYNSSREQYQLAPFSGRGPTDDGRVKPDIVASGVSIISTINSDKNIYGTSNGTSMATPIVTGGIALIQEVAKKHLKKTLKAATVKALVINEAQEAGNYGPDYSYGWGVFDAFRSVKAIENNKKGSLVEEFTLNNNETKTIYVTASGKENLKATIAWTDLPGEPSLNPVLNDRSKKLIHDLDIRIFDEKNEIYLPWKLNVEKPSELATRGDNDVDNIEQVVIENAKRNKVYRIQITHKGNLLYGGQNFSLVATGLKARKNQDLIIKSLESKEDRKSYDTPGVYLTLDGAKEFKNIKVHYTLKSVGQEIVLEKTKKINYDPNNHQPIFLELKTKKFSPTTKDKYIVEVNIMHEKDRESRNNYASINYHYFVSRITSKKDLFYQDFSNYNLKLMKENMLGSSSLSFGWKGNPNHTSYSEDSRKEGISIALLSNEAEIKSPPFYLKENKNYHISLWGKSSDEEQNKLKIIIKDAFSDKPIESFVVLPSEVENEDYKHYTHDFLFKHQDYVYFEIQNQEGGVISIDDISLAFTNSEAVIVKYEVGPPMDRAYLGSGFSYLAWNTYKPVLYDFDYKLIDTEKESYTYDWKVKYSDYQFVEGTTVNSSNPKIIFLDENSLVNVQLTVNNKFKSSSNEMLRTANVNYGALYFSNYDYFTKRARVQAWTTDYPEGFEVVGFLNSTLGFSVFGTAGEPRQTSYTEGDEGYFKGEIYVDKTTGYEYSNTGRGRIKRFTFREPGEYKTGLTFKDSYTNGERFNETSIVHNYKIYDQFQPIANLNLKNKKNKYKLTWENPPLYYFEVMTFDENSENDIEKVQFKGQSKLNWRLYSDASGSDLATNGLYSIVSESIDEETLVHEDIDNWFFIKKPNKAAAKYFSFITSMSKQYTEDRYEAYLLDAALVNIPGKPTINDFISHGVKVKTQEKTGLDKELISHNYSFLKMVDLEKEGLMNKEVYIAFRHNTKKTDNGSFLAIDFLKFHNVLDDVVQTNYRYNELFNTSGKAEDGWKSLNPHVYPIKGYEISEIDNQGNRNVIQTIDDMLISTVSLNKKQISPETVKLGVKLLYDVSTKTDGAEFNQDKDIPNEKELTVQINGVESQSKELLESNIVIFPVPTEDILTVKVTGEYRGLVHYKIADTSGKIVSKGQFYKKKSNQRKELNLGGLKSDVYYMKIGMGKEVYSKKIIKK